MQNSIEFVSQQQALNMSDEQAIGKFRAMIEILNAALADSESETDDINDLSSSIASVVANLVNSRNHFDKMIKLVRSADCQTIWEDVLYDIQYMEDAKPEAVIAVATRVQRNSHYDQRRGVLDLVVERSLDTTREFYNALYKTYVN